MVVPGLLFCFLYPDTQELVGALIDRCYEWLLTN